MASIIILKKTSILKKITSPLYPCMYYSSSAAAAAVNPRGNRRAKSEQKELDEEIPTEGISRPMSEILKQLNKKVPDSLIKVRSDDRFSASYIPWHIVNRIMNLHAPEWCGEVRSITYAPDSSCVSVVYRVTLHGTDAEISREATGTVACDGKCFGDPVQKAEAMAFRRACARLGLGLHLYHEDMM